jgi:hypothetical protein
MKARTNFLIALVVLLIFSACATNQENSIKTSEWLIGTWVNQTSKGSIYETWSKVNENELSGKSYSLAGNDTIVFENIQMVVEQDGFFYIPKVVNQNDGLPVRFSAKTISETQLSFENQEHDFPQVISYTKITPDSLVAEISGSINGEDRRQSFPMKKVR